MLGLILGNLCPVEEELNRQPLSIDLKVGKACDNVPRQIDGVLFDVCERVWIGK